MPDPASPPPPASFPLPPPLAGLPIVNSDGRPTIPFLNFLQLLWAGIQGKNGVLDLLALLEALARIPGTDGQDGEDGVPGGPGARGAVGPAGLIGPPGSDGEDGETGILLLNTGGGGTGSALASGDIWVGNASNVAAAVAPSGDVTMDNAGVFTIKTNVSLAGSPTTTTQSVGDNSTKIATTAFVQGLIAGLNPAESVNAATTAAGDTSGFTYNNGASGIGATLTGTVNTAVTIDGYTFTAVGQRLLVKNDTQSPSGAFNGVYFLSQLQTSLLAPVFTRSVNYDQPSDINDTGPIPVFSGTANSSTMWVLTSTVATVGTDPLTFAKFGSGSGTVNSGTSGQVAYYASSGTAVSGETLSALIDAAIGSTQGQVLYRSASAWAVLAVGTSGMFLQTLGASANPQWATGLIPGNNLSDVSNAATSRGNLSAEPAKTLNGINTQTASYTLVIGDAGLLVEMNVGSANALTVPPNSSVAFDVNTRVDVVQLGAGQVTITAGAGVTIRSSSGKLKLTGQYSGATLYKRGTDEWVLLGDIAA